MGCRNPQLRFLSEQSHTTGKIESLDSAHLQSSSSQSSLLTCHFLGSFTAEVQKRTAADKTAAVFNLYERFL